LHADAAKRTDRFQGEANDRSFVFAGAEEVTTPA
jgi:hypothetical protein